MSNNTQITESILKSLISNSTAADTKKRALSLLAGGGNIPTQGYSAIAIAYMLILQAVNTSSHSAVIHSKELSSNALAQQKLNALEERQSRFSIPKEHVKHYTVEVRHTRWEVTHTPGGSWWPTNKVYWTKKVKSKVVNRTQIDEANAKNQEIAKQRQGIENKLKLLQQGAQINETRVNNIVDESMQTMQEGAQIMNILRNLTFKALLRQAPSV